MTQEFYILKVNANPAIAIIRTSLVRW